MNYTFGRRWAKVIYAIAALFILCPWLVCGVVFGPPVIDVMLRIIPWPTPLPIALTNLPLSDAAITPGPAVTPDWEDEDSSFRRELNSEVGIFSNRFGIQWVTNERIGLTVRIFDEQYSDRLPAYVSQAGEIEGRLWSYSIVFPWPREPFIEQQVYAIDGATETSSSIMLARDATGPAAAEFLEANPNPPGLYDGPLARCRYQVRGQITLTSYSPVVGHFQFACQFDATEYALVSGWFWE